MNPSAAPNQDWTRLRRPREPVVEARLSVGILCIEMFEDVIDERASRLFACLPYACRLSATRARFPHVANRIAAHWNDPRGFREVTDDLLIDRRGGRQGFPLETVHELTRLRGWYDEQVVPRIQRATARPPDSSS